MDKTYEQLLAENIQLKSDVVNLELDNSLLKQQLKIFENKPDPLQLDYLTQENKKLKEENDSLLTIVEDKEESFHNILIQQTYKEDFISHISHDLRTPLNGIIGLVDSLIIDLKNTKYSSNLELLKDTTKDLYHILNNILDTSKLKSGNFEIHKESFSLKSFVQKIENTFSFSKKNIDFSVSLDSQLPDVIFSDELRITQIVNNLLSNSFKFTNSGFVKLKITQINNNINFTVIDSGIGFDEEFKQKIGSPFIQNVNINNKSEPGTGLGLFIVKNLVGLLGGHFSINSFKNTYTSVFFSIPLVEGNKEDIIDDSFDFKLFDTKKMLLVDDLPLNLTIGKKYFENIGFNVFCASSGLEAIELCKKKDFDVVLLDLQMPIMDGYDTCTHLLELNKNLNIFAYSASILDKELNKTLHYSMKGLIEKPFNKKNVLFNLKKIFSFDFFPTVIQNSPKKNYSINESKQLTFQTFSIKEYLKMNIDLEDIYEIYIDFYKNFSDFEDTLNISILEHNSSVLLKYLHNLKSVSGHLSMQPLFDYTSNLYTNFNSLKKTQKKNLFFIVKDSLIKTLEEIESTILHSTDLAINTDISSVKNKTLDFINKLNNFELITINEFESYQKSLNHFGISHFDKYSFNDFINFNLKKEIINSLELNLKEINSLII